MHGFFEAGETSLKIMKSWKTTVSGAGVLVCGLVAIFFPEWAGKCAAAGSLLSAFGLMAARDNNVTSEMALGVSGPSGPSPALRAPSPRGEGKLPFVGLVALSGILVLGTGCMGNSLAKLAKELAKDPATLSLRVRVGTPYGTGEMDYARSGLTTNNATAGGGAIALNGAKKAGSQD